MCIGYNFPRAQLTTGNYTKVDREEYSSLFGSGKMETSGFLLLADTEVHAVLTIVFLSWHSLC